MYSDVLRSELDSGQVIVDPTRFVADPDKAKRFPELPYVTLRLAMVACAHFNADIGLASVRPEHRAFYRKVFFHDTLGEPRLFPGLIKPVGLMAANYSSIRERVFQRFPMMRSSAFERRMLFERGGERHPRSDAQRIREHPTRGASVHRRTRRPSPTRWSDRNVDDPVRFRSGPVTRSAP